MLDIRVVLFLLGVMLSIMATTMLVPMAIEFFVFQTEHWQSFALSSFICGFIGTLLSVANNPDEKIQLGVRETFLLTTLTWLMCTLICALPFYLGKEQLTFLDCWYETVSALTTTGSSVFTHLDLKPKAFLLWRGILQFIGGIGIVLMALAVLPILRIGGMQLYRSEFSDRSEKILPRLSQVTNNIVLVYTLLTIFCCLMLYTAGMEFFDSACHAMGILATGGLSTKDTSIAYYNNGLIEIICTLFMYLGGGTMLLYVRIWQKDTLSFFKDSQFKVYTLILIIVSCGLALWHTLLHDAPWWVTLRQSFFSVVSLMTTTGYVVTDFSAWGSFADVIMIMVSIIGGCSGSTAGGVKVFRIQVMMSMIMNYLRQLRRLYGVHIPRYDNEEITDPLAVAVLTFICLYLLCLFIMTLIATLSGLNFGDAFAGVVSSLGNIGVGCGPVVGPSGSFATLPSAVKVNFIVCMLLGRLELFTILVLFIPSFWKS